MAMRFRSVSVGAESRLQARQWQRALRLHAAQPMALDACHAARAYLPALAPEPCPGRGYFFLTATEGRASLECRPSIALLIS